MTAHKLKSTSLEHVDWHEPATMEIKFISGATYHYPNCDKVHYENLKKVASAGGYFQKAVRNLKAVRVD